MGLTEVPSELFRMKSVKTLNVSSNNLCSLPSEIAHLTTLEQLAVRLSKRLDHDLTKPMLFQVSSNQLTSLPPALGLLTNLKRLFVRHSRQMDLDLTLRRRDFRSARISSRRCQQKSAS
jgi:leucine-rich repeat protein SHOC2